MSWTMLYNGNCPPPGPEPFKFVYSYSGSDNQMAIDNQGRMYTWGTAEQNYTGQTPVAIPATSNFSPHPAIVNGGAGSGLQIHYPYQVGNAGGWKNVKNYYSIFLAQDSENYLYAWGDGFWGQGGWSTTAQYQQTGPSSARIYTPGGEYSLLPTKVNNSKWLDFGSGFKHVIALGADKRAYVWGTNSNARVFGMPEYVAGQKSLVPILVNTLPDIPLKIVSGSSENNIVVTESDQIYAWGMFSWTPIVLTPQIVPLTIPSGVTIKQAIATSQGIVILLTNGEIYCRGYRMQFAPSPDWYAATLTKIPGNHFYTYISAYENEVGALDSQGNIWGWGVAKEFISRDDAFCNQAIYLPGEEPVFVGTPTLGERKFTYFSVGNTSHCGIDTQGRLFCWGFDLWGQLGVNNSPTDHSCSPLQVYNPTLYDGTLAYDEVVAGAAASSIRIRTPLPQLSAHDPCGHWHKGSQSYSQDRGGYPDNCWEVTAATKNDEVLYVVCGRHQPHHFLMLVYSIPSNNWRTPVYRENILYSNWDGGAAVDGDTYAFHCTMADTEGGPFNETYYNPRMRTCVIYGADVYEKEWVGTTVMNGRNKVAVSGSGLVVVLISFGSDLQVHASTNGGSSYALIFSVPLIEIDEAAVVIGPNDGLVYLSVVSAANNRMRVYRGSGTGTGWAIRSTTTITGAQTLEFRANGTRFFASVQGTLGPKFYYSTDDCTTFIVRDYQAPGRLIAATGTELYNLTDSTDYYTTDYEPSSPVWIPTNPSTKTGRATLHNRGQITVYTHADMRRQFAGPVSLAFLLSFTVGREWKTIPTPLAWYETFEDVVQRNDNPVWDFYPQPLKI